MPKAKETTSKVTSISTKLELESLPKQLSQVKTEFLSRSCSAPSNAGTDGEPIINQRNPDGFTEIKVEDDIEFGEPSIFVQSIPETYNDTEQHNYQTSPGGSTAITVECEVDIKIEDEMEFCGLSSTVQSIPGTDDEEHSNQTIQDKFTEIEDQMEFSNEEEIDAETKVSDKYSKIPHEFSCDICSKKFPRKSNLTKHRLRHGKPNVECTICGVAKFNQSELNKHMRTHDANRTCFTCDICSVQCLSKANLTKHRLRHGNPNFHCTVCGVTKFSKYHLDLHMRTHDTNRIYVTCDICTKSVLETHLSRHQKLHGKQNFKCSVCGAGKITQLEMDRHMKLHDTNRTCFESHNEDKSDQISTSTW